MKKLPILAAIMFLVGILSVGAQAPIVPTPIKITLSLNGVLLDEEEVTVTLVDYGKTLTSADVPSLKSEKGMIMFDLYDFGEDPYHIIAFQKQIKIEFTYENDVHIYLFTPTSLDPKENMIVFGATTDKLTADEIADKESTPSTPSDPTVIQDCPDCILPVIPPCPGCPACPVLQPTTCPESEVCPNPVVCPEERERNPLLIALTAILGLAVGGTGIYFLKRNEAELPNKVGIKVYLDRKGEMVRLHRHPGIVGYHDPKTRHRDTNDRHDIGQLDPVYEYNEKGIPIYKR